MPHDTPNDTSQPSPLPARDLTVAEMAADGAVSRDLVRQWCRQGLIGGAWNAGDKGREYWRAPAAGWQAFKVKRQQYTIPELRSEVRARRRTSRWEPMYVIRDDEPKPQSRLRGNAKGRKGNDHAA